MRSFILPFILCFLLFSCGENTETKAPTEYNKTTDDDSSSLSTPHSHDDEVDGCVFNKDTVSDAFIKKVPEFENYTWNDITKEARIVLPNKDSLYIHIGGCENYGVSATLTRIGNKKQFSDHTYWLSEAYWMAERIKGFELALLKKMDKQKKYTVEMDDEGLFIDFHEHDYSLIVDRKDDCTFITLNHYFN